MSETPNSLVQDSTSLLLPLSFSADAFCEQLSKGLFPSSWLWFSLLCHWRTEQTVRPITNKQADVSECDPLDNGSVSYLCVRTSIGFELHEDRVDLTESV